MILTLPSFFFFAKHTGPNCSNIVRIEQLFCIKGWCAFHYTCTCMAKTNVCFGSDRDAYWLKAERDPPPQVLYSNRQGNIAHIYLL